jgi:hypothetical protein
MNISTIELLHTARRGREWSVHKRMGVRVWVRVRVRALVRVRDTVKFRVKVGVRV